jgi:hypothetical protein
MSEQTINVRLQSLLDQVWKLRPNWQDPEKFHETKSEVVAQLRALIKEANAMPGGIPVVATRAKEALRQLHAEVPEAAPAPTAKNNGQIIEDHQNITESKDREDTEDAGDGEDSVDSPPQGQAEPLPDVATLHAMLAGIEKATLDLQTQVQAQASLPPPQPASPPGEDMETLYRRRHLTTDDGRRTAATLWAHGLTLPDIANCFDYQGPAGTACVRAALILFLLQHHASDEWLITDATITELIRQTLRQDVTKATQAAPGPKAVSAPAPAPAAESPSATYARADLRTVEGRAKVTELWVAGRSMRSIGELFGWSTETGTGEVAIWQAINRFLREDCGLNLTKVRGPKRKRLARKALRQFHSSTTTEVAHD